MYLNDVTPGLNLLIRKGGGKGVSAAHSYPGSGCSGVLIIINLKTITTEIMFVITKQTS